MQSRKVLRLFAILRVILLRQTLTLVRIDDFITGRNTVVMERKVVVRSGVIEHELCLLRVHLQIQCLT